MPVSPSDRALLLDMLAGAEEVRDYVAGRTRDEYETDRMFRRAVERVTEIIGEAVRGISTELKAAHPEVPWHQISATRHILAHEYGRIDNEIMWRIATVHLLELIRLLGPIIASQPADPS